MEIIKDFDNKLLHRKEVLAKIDVEGATLSRADAKAQLVKKLKADEKLVVVNSIESHFGSRTVQVSAYVYEKEDIMNKLTSEHVKKRNTVEVKEAEA